MSKTKTYNPFSETLMNLIDGVYSRNSSVAAKSFGELVNYFKTGLATAKEVEWLIMSNANYIVVLLDDINDQPKAHELLRSTVGKVVADNLSIPSEGEEDVGATGETADFIE